MRKHSSLSKGNKPLITEKSLKFKGQQLLHTFSEKIKEKKISNKVDSQKLINGSNSNSDSDSNNDPESNRNGDNNYSNNNNNDHDILCDINQNTPTNKYEFHANNNKPNDSFIQIFKKRLMKKSNKHIYQILISSKVRVSTKIMK